MPPSVEPSGDLPAIDLRVLFRRFWTGRYRILAVCLAFAAVGMFFAARLQPTYTAESRVLLGQLATSIAAEEAEFAITLDNQRLATAVEVLTSTRVLGGVADVLIDNEDDAAAIEILGLAPNTSDGQEDLLALLLPNDSAPTESEMPSEGDVALDWQLWEDPSIRSALTNGIRDNLIVARVSDSAVLRLRYTSGDPSVSARIANLVVDQYIQELRTARAEAGRFRLSWLSEQIEDIRTQIHEAEDAVEVRRAELSLEAGQGLGITERRLVARADELTDAQSDTARLQLLYARLSSALGDADRIKTIAEFRDTSVINELSDVVRDLENRTRDLPEANPARQLMISKIEEARINILEEAERIAASVQEELIAAQAREENLSRQVRELESQVFDLTRAQLDLRQLEMDADVRRASFEELNRQLLSTTGRSGLSPIGVQVLSRAEASELVSSSRGRTLVLLALATGLVLGVGWVVLAEINNNKFRTAQELEDSVGSVVLGRVPFAPKKAPKAVLKQFQTDPRSPLVESLRGLSATLIAHFGERRASSTMITSSIENENASLIALMTALQLQKQKNKVLLIECDMQRGDTISFLDLSGELDGLEGVLEGTLELSDAVMTDKATGLDVLPIGVSDTPVELFTSKAYRELLPTLEKEYDFVIVNAPPALSVSDAKIIAPTVDGVLFVVAWNKTNRSTVRQGLRELFAVGAPVTGLVFSGINEERAALYEPGGSAKVRSTRTAKA